jgi:hypothetical protein
VTVAVFVPPAVPPIVTSPVANPVTDELKTTVKLIGEVLVGSAWPLAWLIVTVGPAAVTAIAGLVLAVLVPSVASVAVIVEPVVRRVTEKLRDPPDRVLLAGSVARLSELVIAME